MEITLHTTFYMAVIMSLWLINYGSIIAVLEMVFNDVHYFYLFIYRQAGNGRKEGVILYIQPF